MEDCNIVPDGEYDLTCTVHERNAIACYQRRVELLKTENGELRDLLREAKPYLPNQTQPLRLWNKIEDIDNTT